MLFLLQMARRATPTIVSALNELAKCDTRFKKLFLIYSLCYEWLDIGAVAVHTIQY